MQWGWWGGMGGSGVMKWDEDGASGWVLVC